MKRVTQDDLEARAAESGQSIEFDNETNVAYLTVGRETFYASLPAPAVTR